MSGYDRREAAARALLNGQPAAVPPDLYGESVRRGRRILRRRRTVRWTLGVLLCVAVVAFTVWAVTARPWVRPPSTVTPIVVDR